MFLRVPKFGVYKRLIFFQKLEAKMKELEKQHQEELERAQEEATMKMGELEEVLQGKVTREMELEREREILRTEADEIKVAFPLLRNGKTLTNFRNIFCGEYHKIFFFVNKCFQVKLAMEKEDLERKLAADLEMQLKLQEEQHQQQLQSELEIVRGQKRKV